RERERVRREQRPGAGGHGGIGERLRVEEVVGRGAGAARRRLDDVRLRPAHVRGAEELDAALVEDARPCGVELRRRDVLRLRPRGVRHVAPVELVHPGREGGAAGERVPEPVARRPRVRAQPQGRRRPDVALDELGRAAEPAGGEQDELALGERRRRAERHAAGPSRERVGEAPRVEAHARGARVAGPLRDDRRAERAQPRERVVEALEDEPLERRLAGGALAPERVPLAVAPDDARARAHRAAAVRALLEHARADGGREAGHPRAGDDHESENEGLCSTYSIRTPSGPVRNAAYVFGASTTDSTSIPSSAASATASSAESTRTARWLRSGRSGAPVAPGRSSTYAPATSTRPGPAGAKP